MLWKVTAHDMAVRCGTSTTMDLKRVQVRVEHEGLSFLTITLPTFGNGFQKSLDLGYLDRSLFTGFRFRAGLPLFLGGFLDLVFDRGSGRLLEEPDIEAILAIRQLTLMFGKISLPCTPARRRKAMKGYFKCEQDIKQNDPLVPQALLEDFHRVSSLLFRRVFQVVDREIYYLENVIPKHGPGATSDYISGNQKWNQTTWPVRLEKIFPSGEFLLPNFSYFEDLEAIDILEPEAEIPVRVISVPKTLKTPRIIGIEPTAMQYAQQAVKDTILRNLEQVDYLDQIIGFKDQTPNQRMAREGSLSGELATLDLSEASDRVSNQHVRLLLRDFPHLSEAVDASRSRKADVPGIGVIRLSKFASMGSALCFPMEAMVFTTLIFMGIERELSSPLRRRDIVSLAGKVRVYGDDIIVPVEYVSSVVEMLQAFGSVVNLGKSFWNGKFRESCGKEYYDGEDVSIVRVRQVFPTRRQDVTEVVSLVSYRNQAYFAGMWNTCMWLDGYIRKILKYFPVVHPESSVQGRHSFLPYQGERDDANLHSPLVRGWRVTAVPPVDRLEGAGALLKCLTQLERRCESTPELGGESDIEKYQTLPTSGCEHLERAGRPRAVNIKLGWAQPF